MMHNLYDLLGSKVQEYISFYGLRSYGKLFDGGPVATSQVYICVCIYIFLLGSWSGWNT